MPCINNNLVYSFCKQFSQHHSAEQICCQKNSCTFWPDEQLTTAVPPTQGGPNLNDWLEALVHLLLWRLSSTMFGCRDIVANYTGLPDTYRSDSFTGTSEMFMWVWVHHYPHHHLHYPQIRTFLFNYVLFEESVALRFDAMLTQKLSLDHSSTT